MTVPLLGDLQDPPGVAHAIVAPDDPLVLDAEDVPQAGGNGTKALPCSAAANTAKRALCSHR
jgi:hypothetical protein